MSEPTLHALVDANSDLSPPSERRKVLLQDSIERRYPMLNFTISMEEEEQIMADVKHVLSKFFPDKDFGQVQLKRFTDGITNKLFKVVTSEFNPDTSKKTSSSVLVRVYGHNTELLIDREQEILVLVCLAREGLSTPLYGRFTNGICYGFIKGDPFTIEDMKHPHKSYLVARHLARFHSINVIGKSWREATLFQTLNKWLKALEDVWSPSSSSSSSSSPSSSDNNEGDSSNASNDVEKSAKKEALLAEYRAELRFLEQELTRLNSRIVFCHNDLLAGNIIYVPDGSGPCVPSDLPIGEGSSANDPLSGALRQISQQQRELQLKRSSPFSAAPAVQLTSSAAERLASDLQINNNDNPDGGEDWNPIAKVQFIDFEYGNYNYRAFDIANHFGEMTGYQLDLSLYPDEEFQKRWLTTYVSRVRELASAGFKAGYSHTVPSYSAEPEKSLEEEVLELQDQVNKFSAAAHYFWGIWAHLQAEFTSASDFDYAAYAQKRMSAYFTTKARYLTSSSSSSLSE